MNMVTKEEALKLLFEAWAPIRETETVPLEEAYGRVLAEPQFARYSLPVVRAALMDSVALSSGDFAHGIPDTSGWRRGAEYDRADMGDDFDDKFDAAIPVESVTFAPDGGISIEAGTEIKPGVGIKEKGNTVREGQLLLQKGVKLNAADLAVLAIGGAVSIPVRRRPVVAVIPTGSELIPRGTAPARGENIEANSVMLRYMLQEMGAEPLVFPIVRDALEQMGAVLDEALSKADIVVVNGGSSKGDEDLSTSLLRHRGTFLFHGVKKVPGRPLSISVSDGKPILNLPGPPPAAFNGANWCLRAAVARYLDLSPEDPLRVSAVLSEPLESPLQMEFTSRVSVSCREDGSYLAETISLRKSTLAESLGSNGILVSPIGRGSYAAGETVEVELLRNPAHLPRKV